MREIAHLLKRVESYVIVASLALAGQDVEQDREIKELLRRDAGSVLFKQIAHTLKLASQCDGLPLGEEDEGRVQDWEEDADADTGGGR